MNDADQKIASDKWEKDKLAAFSAASARLSDFRLWTTGEGTAAEGKFQRAMRAYKTRAVSSEKFYLCIEPIACNYGGGFARETYDFSWVTGYIPEATKVATYRGTGSDTSSRSVRLSESFNRITESEKQGFTSSFQNRAASMTSKMNVVMTMGTRRYV